MIFNKAKKIAIIAASALMSLTVSAQDKLAMQTPADKAMNALDSMRLKQLLKNEVWENSPAAELLYDIVTIPGSLPDTFVIKLKNNSMPTKSTIVTSNFGARWGRQHKGLDIKVYTTDTIRAAFDGVVRTVKYEPRGYGKYVVLYHNYNGLETVYGHLSKQLVKEGQTVHAGDPIGMGGNTGRSTGTHLHFETRLCGVALNPALMFDFREGDVVADTWCFNRKTYDRESRAATLARGAKTAYRGGDGLLANMPGNNGKANRNKGKDGGAYYNNHKVQKGETLYSIARKHSVTVDHLCKVNRINKNTKIKINQILKY